jgi:hypothetical protein
LKLISNDGFFIKQALLLYVNAFAVPGAASYTTVRRKW